ncbi:excinuclease ABC subunit C [Polynucleobacter aenigmaticus]|uniref:Excinuclease ABC subunit C n=1 Tax=Polynucleobacter aenigmaticus TaxID=1743164 RepID=A0A254QAR4_9BURK|nr:GIY-YIG nuclease family protein [Polynucleobacter aenigmaticus]OWS71977.1 excinuclease ABC subunit C [Polynucleobacter aenigmaticus]
MKTSPKTIQIFLPTGDPRGIRVAEITTRIVRVIEVPRSLVSDFLKMPEAGQVGLYFLSGESDDGDVLKLYVGQSGNVGTRITQHNQAKDFWNKALVLVSLTNNLTQTHALFLEWLSIKEAKAADRYRLENGNPGTRPHTPAPLEADCHEIYETSRVLLATLGYPIFESLSKAASNKNEDEVFYCAGSGANGRGLYTEEGFVVLKGSIGRIENVPSMQDTAGSKLRERLMNAGVTRVEANSVIFEKDHLFRSPSMAALSLMGRSANGWLEWKNKEGKTLDAIKRQ